jgi:hypothetical protein
MHTGPWQCALFLIPRSFHDGSALNYSTAPHRSKTTLISNGVFGLLESKILSIGQTLLYSLACILLFGIALICMSFNLVQSEVINNVKEIAKQLGFIKAPGWKLEPSTGCLQVSH